MAVSSIISRVCDLNKPLVMETLDHLLVMGDDKGDQFDIAVAYGNEPKDLLNGSVLGYFIKLEPGKKIEDCDTVTIFGTKSGNIATVVLPESCYVTPCRFILTVKVSLENTRHAVYIAEGAVARSSTSRLIDPGHNIPDIEELLALISRIEGAAESAYEAANRANDAAQKANNNASSANTAATNATNAANAANAASKSANDAADAANEAASSADKAASSANTAATNAQSAANSVNKAIQDAAQATTDAKSATSDAALAAEFATKSANSAQQATILAEKWGNVQITVTMIEPEGDATVALVDLETGKRMDFRIPRGLTGLTPNLTLGNVNTVSFDQEARAELRGTKEDPILDLWIPKGKDGSVEGIPYSDVPALNLSEEARSGSSNLVSRADHQHAFPTAEEVGAIYLDSNDPTLPGSPMPVNADTLSGKSMQDMIDEFRPIIRLAGDLSGEGTFGLDEQYVEIPAEIKKNNLIMLSGGFSNIVIGDEILFLRPLIYNRPIFLKYSGNDLLMTGYCGSNNEETINFSGTYITSSGANILFFTLTRNAKDPLRYSYSSGLRVTIADDGKISVNKSPNISSINYIMQYAD